MHRSVSSVSSKSNATSASGSSTSTSNSLNSSSPTSPTTEPSFKSHISTITSDLINHFSQSMISLLSDQQASLDKFASLFLDLQLGSSSTDFVQSVIKVLDRYRNIKSVSSNEDDVWLKHRNVCGIFVPFIAKFRKEIDPEALEHMADYLFYVMEQAEHLEAVLYAILAFEQLLVQDRQEKLESILQNLSKFIEDTPTHYTPRLVPYRYQVGLCSSWLLDRKCEESAVKFSPDRMSARCDQQSVYPTILSALPLLTEEVFYFEVTLVTSGETRIGWTTLGSQLGPGPGQGLGCDQGSIGLDGFNRCLWFVGKKHLLVADEITWEAGDIIGCLLDVPSRKYVFTINSKQVELLDQNQSLTFVDGPYFAAATLAPHQQLYFNHGHTPFVYNPEHTEIFNRDQPEYSQLIPPHEFQTQFWYKHSLPETRQWRLFYRDMEQLEFDQWVMEFEPESKMTSKLNSLLAKSKDPNRILYSILRLLGMNSEIDLKYFDSLTSDVVQACSRKGIPELNLAKFLEMIYPYTLRVGVTDEEIIQQRSLVYIIYLALRICSNDESFNLFQKYPLIQEFLKQSLKNKSSQDHWSLVFGMNCLLNKCTNGSATLESSSSSDGPAVMRRDSSRKSFRRSSKTIQSKSRTLPPDPFIHFANSLILIFNQKQSSLAVFDSILKELVTGIDCPESGFCENILKILELYREIPWPEPWLGHRNVCGIIVALLGSKWFHGPVESFWNYLVKVLDSSENLEAVLYSILVVERILLKDAEGCLKTDILLEALQKHSELLEYSPKEFSPKQTPLRYPVGLCAHSLLERITNQEYSSDLVKVSPDGLSARSDQVEGQTTLLASFPIDTVDQIVYYEVTLVTSGEMRIGWATCEAQFGPDRGLGSDEHSIGFDGRSFWFAGNAHPLFDLPEWWKGDIVGCELDPKNRKLEFSINGQKVSSAASSLTSGSEFWNKLPVYALVTLTSHQQCYFHFSDFRFSTNLSVFPQTQLLKSRTMNNCFWYPRPPESRSRRIHFLDSHQAEFDQLIMELDSCLQKVNSIQLEHHLFEKLQPKLIQLLAQSHGFNRFAFSIIRLWGFTSGLGEVKYDCLAQLLISGGFQLEQVKLIEIVYPYMQMAPQSQEEVIQIRNVLFLLLQVLRYLRTFQEPLEQPNGSKEVLNFVRNILEQSQDELSLLFAINCMSFLFLDKEQKAEILETFGSKLKFLAEVEELPDVVPKRISTNRDQPNSPLAKQLAFCAKWFLGHFQSDRDQIECFPEYSQLDLIFCPKSLTVLNLSTYGICRSEMPLSQELPYYEVTLSTSGSMVIGWCKSPDNEQIWLGYDGFNRTILHKRKRLTFEPGSQIPRWKAGDVLGVGMDSKRFFFSLNGYRIDFKSFPALKKIKRAGRSFYAVAQLGLDQQIEFNFGLSSFVLSDSVLEADCTGNRLKIVK